MVSKGSVHHGKEGMAEYNSHHGSQEAEKGVIQEGPGQDIAPRTCPQ
jgi:hypothetical protein